MNVSYHIFRKRYEVPFFFHRSIKSRHVHGTFETSGIKKVTGNLQKLKVAIRKAL